MPRRSHLRWAALLGGLAFMLPAHAATSPFGATFLWIAVILLAARLANGVERFGMPGVLGELLVGVLLGNLVLVGIPTFEPITEDRFIDFCAQLGVVLLLFQIGLETELSQLRRVGARAAAVAVIGVALPFVLGSFVVGPWLLPGLDRNAYLFIGATLTATSVGITGRVFRDLGWLQSNEARIVLGAAVIDDVMGIIILAVVSSLVVKGSIDALQVIWLIAEAVGFLGGALLVGRWLGPSLARALSRVSSGVGMKLTLVVATGLLLAAGANAIGLAPIVGAFAAGLLLEPALLEDFEGPDLAQQLRPFEAGLPQGERAAYAQVLDSARAHHAQHLVEPLGHFFVPVFFVFTGMQVDLATLGDPKVVIVALALTAAALAGKVAAGSVAGPVNRWLVGWGMAPRGEVGLIFAMVGRELGVVTPELFSVILVMVILTTLLTPPILIFIIRRHEARQGKPA